MIEDFSRDLILNALQYIPLGLPEEINDLPGIEYLKIVTETIQNYRSNLSDDLQRSFELKYCLIQDSETGFKDYVISNCLDSFGGEGYMSFILACVYIIELTRFSISYRKCFRFIDTASNCIITLYNIKYSTTFDRFGGWTGFKFYCQDLNTRAKSGENIPPATNYNSESKAGDDCPIGNYCYWPFKEDKDFRSKVVDDASKAKTIFLKNFAIYYDTVMKISTRVIESCEATKSVRDKYSKDSSVVSRSDLLVSKSNESDLLSPEASRKDSIYPGTISSGDLTSSKSVHESDAISVKTIPDNDAVSAKTIPDSGTVISNAIPNSDAASVKTIPDIDAISANAFSDSCTVSAKTIPDSDAVNAMAIPMRNVDNSEIVLEVESDNSKLISDNLVWPVSYLENDPNVSTVISEDVLSDIDWTEVASNSDYDWRDAVSDSDQDNPIKVSEDDTSRLELNFDREQEFLASDGEQELASESEREESTSHIESESNLIGSNATPEYKLGTTDSKVADHLSKVSPRKSHPFLHTLQGIETLKPSFLDAIEDGKFNMNVPACEWCGCKCINYLLICMNLYKTKYLLLLEFEKGKLRPNGKSDNVS